MTKSLVFLMTLSLLSIAMCPITSKEPPQFDVLIKNVRIVDGSGRPGYNAAIATKAPTNRPHRQFRECNCCKNHRRERNGGGARVHRYAGPVRNVPAHRSARNEQSNDGSHYRNYRRG